MSPFAGVWGDPLQLPRLSHSDVPITNPETLLLGEREQDSEHLNAVCESGTV